MYILLKMRSADKERLILGETFISCALFHLGLICVNSGTGVSVHGRLLLAIILSLKV